MRLNTFALIALIITPLCSCKVTIDYDHPHQVTEEEFNKAMAIFASGSATFEIDDKMNEEHEVDPGNYRMNGKIDFKNNIFYGTMERNDPDTKQSGELYLYYGENFVVNKYYSLNEGDTFSDKGTRYDRLIIWENKPKLSIAEVMVSKEYSESYMFQVDGDFSSYKFDASTTSYVGKFGSPGWRYDEIAIQFSSGRISRVFFSFGKGSMINSWYKLTEINSTKVDIPDDVREYGTNGPANYSNGRYSIPSDPVKWD